jgi:tetratricopeptide (TPR) repeat protein
LPFSVIITSFILGDFAVIAPTAQSIEMNAARGRFQKNMRFTECQIFHFRSILLVSICCLLFVFTSCSSHSKDAYLKRGEEYLQKRKFHDAAMQFRAAADIDKDSANAHWGLARAYENLGQFNETIDELRKVVDLNPDNLDAKAKLGNYFLLVQPPLIDEANKSVEEIFAKDPNFIEGHILKASILAAQGKPEKDVVDILNKAISIDPNRTGSYVSLARYYMTLEKAAEAEEAVKKSISVNPAVALGYIEYGQFLTYAQRSPEAEAQFKKAVETEPNSIEAREAIAEYYLGERRYDNAEQCYKDLVTVQENSPESRVDLADFYAEIGRSDEAIAVFNGILTDAPEYVRARYRLGEIYLGRKESAKVYEQLGVLFSINDNDTEALMLRARVQLQENKAAEAVKDLEEILKKQPSQKDALFYMAQAQLSLGKIDQAKAFIGDLERFHPNFIRAKLLKIQVSFAAGESEAALKQANELYELAKSSYPTADMDAQQLMSLRVQAQSARGLAYLDLGKLAEARTDLQEIVKLSPSSASAMVNLAKVSIAEKNTAEALGLYEKALNADSKSFDALSGMVNVLNAQKQYPQSHARVEKALQDGKADTVPSLRYLNAEIFMAEKNTASAEAELKKAIEMDENYLPAYSAYASLLVSQGQTESAIAQYQTIVAKKPSPAIYTLLGMLEDGRGNKAEAEKNYRKALEIAPETAIAANNLAWLLAENQGNLDEALQLAQTSVNKNQTVAGFYDTLGFVYFQKGLYLPAVEQMKKAVALDEAQALKSGKGVNAGYRARLAKAQASAGDRASR